MSELKNVKQLVEDLFRLRSEAEAIEETLSAKNKELTSIKSQLVECLSSEGLDQFDVPDVGKVNIKNIYNWKLPQGEDRQAFFNYLKEKGQEDMLTVNHNTFNSFCKKELESAQERGELSLTIPGVPEPTLYQTVTMRKG